MPMLIFIESNGTAHKVQAESGQSVMRAALDAAVPGILADSGGNCSCATCHGYVDAAWLGRLPPPAANEHEMLQGVLEPHENSRLTCQLKVTPDLDGLTIRLPKSQV